MLTFSIVRSRRLPLYVMLLLLALGLTSEALAQSVDELVQKNISALGGAERIQAVQSKKITGTIAVQGMTMPVVILNKRPNKMRSEVSAQGMAFVTAYDGKTAWTINPMVSATAQKLPEAQAQAVERQASMDVVLLGYEDRGYTATYGGEADVNGRKAHRIVLKHVSGEEITVFLDAETFLDSQLEMEMVDPTAGKVRTQMRLGDYREVNGIKMPFRIQSILQGQTVSDITIESIQLGGDLDDALFQFPGTP